MVKKIKRIYSRAQTDYMRFAEGDMGQSFLDSVIFLSRGHPLQREYFYSRIVQTLCIK